MLVAAVAVLTVGCSSYYWDESDWKPTAKSLSGTWEHKGPDGVVASLAFSADGVVTATDIPSIGQAPKTKSGVDVAWTRLASGTGHWKVDPDQYWTVQLTPDATGLSSEAIPSWLLAVTSAKKVRWLYIVVGDPDEKMRFGFTKATS